MSTSTPPSTRDAWNTIRGYVYQVDLTIKRWLDLQPGQILELERGEDIDIVDLVSYSPTATPEERSRLSEQVKHRDNSSITLGASEAVTAIAHFIENRRTNPGLRFLYTTNASVGREQKSPMSKEIKAIDAWEQIRQGSLHGTEQNEAVQGIRTILLEKVEKPNTARLANGIAQRINNPMEKAIATALIAEVMAKADKSEEAKTIFDSATEIAQTIQIELKHVNSFIAIAKAQVRAKKYTDARKTAKMIKYPDSIAEILGAIAKAQAEDGKLEESQITLTNAFEIAERSYMEWERVKILCTIAEAQAVKEKEAAQLTLERAKREGSKYLWKIAEAQAKIGEVTIALQLLNEVEDQWEQIIVLFCIAWTQFKKKEQVSTLDAAVDAKDKIEDEQKREKAFKVIARIQAWVGKGKLAVRTAERFLTERNRYLPKIAEVLTETGDKSSFKKLLIPCSYYLDAAYQICGQLARLYPEKVEEIAKVVSEFR